ncbi:MAG TPA: hypothetical protein VG917_02185 [Patescibacteria group bacterium]|nr:hypothetical protein [Patescibacteria group bacterium]
MKLNRRETYIFLAGLIIGSVIIFLITSHKIASQKSLTKRILNNSIQSMEASNELANSCADAYKTATTCVSNLQSCNIAEESKKLDEYDTRRKHADIIIDWANRDMEQIIKEVSTNR